MSKDTNKESKLTGEERIIELLELLNQNHMDDKANALFELCSYVEVLEHKMDAMTAELSEMRNELASMRQGSVPQKTKGRMQMVADHLLERCSYMKERIREVKDNIVAKASDIVAETKRKGMAALQRVSEFAGLKGKLESMRGMVESSLKDVDYTIGKLEEFGKGMRQVNQTVANNVRTLFDKDAVDYSKKEKLFSKTDVFITPWKTKRKLFAGIDKHLEAAIKSVEHLAEQVEKERKTETAPARTDVSEQIGSPEPVTSMVAENGLQYGADKFEEHLKVKGNEKAVSLAADMAESRKGQEGRRR